MHNYNNTNLVFTQDVLCDISDNDKERPWAKKAAAKDLLACYYEGLGMESKRDRLIHCAELLTFASDSKKIKLVGAQFCRVRLCPMCAWRRSQKIFGQTKMIMEEINKFYDYAYIFVTVTVKNSAAEELSSSINDMMSAWNRFIGYKKIKDISKGWYRGLEVTHNVDECSTSYNTYHPHFHCIFAVNKSYFTSKNYLTHMDWIALWRGAAGLDYDPDVKVKKIKGDLVKAVAEIAKYSVKDADYLIPDEWDLSLSAVKTLDEALDRRRLVAYGGIFKVTHKLLHLDNCIDGDLINTDKKPDDQIEVLAHYTYGWHVGFMQYRRVI